MHGGKQRTERDKLRCETSFIQKNIVGIRGLLGTLEVKSKNGLRSCWASVEQWELQPPDAQDFNEGANQLQHSIPWASLCSP